MVDAQNPIPSPQSGDSDDVELALETAQRLHRNGDPAEALKWLRRAANAADEAGDDRRQLELARAAADYASIAAAGSAAPAEARSPTPSPSRLPQPPTKQPPPAPSARGSVAPTPVAHEGAAPSVRPVGSGGPPPLPAKPRSVTPTPGSVAAVTPTTSVAPQRPTAVSASQAPAPQKPKPPSSLIPTAPKAVTVASLSPSASSSGTSSVAPQATASAGRASVTPKSLQEPEDRATSATSGTVLTAKAPGSGSDRGEEPKPVRASSGPPSGFHDLAHGPGSIRVSVRVSARDENLYVVRPLAPGQRVPVGAREAFLVFEESAALHPALTAQ